MSKQQKTWFPDHLPASLKPIIEDLPKKQSSPVELTADERAQLESIGTTASFIELGIQGNWSFEDLLKLSHFIFSPLMADAWKHLKSQDKLGDNTLFLMKLMEAVFLTIDVNLEDRERKKTFLDDIKAIESNISNAIQLLDKHHPDKDYRD